MAIPSFFSNKYFVPPPHVSPDGLDYSYIPEKGIETYTDYNYLSPGFASLVRTRHFEFALRLTRDYFQKANVIDFGCADGPLLPSLSKHFKRVVGIDKYPIHIELASRVVAKAELKNVALICNQSLTLEQVKSKFGGEKYNVLYLLETLEHIGDKNNLFESQSRFVNDLFSLLDEKGVIVISVPNMVGLPFLLQRLGLFLTGSHREPVSISDLLRASFLCDTSRLEKRWATGHLGVNHRKLEAALSKEMRILKKQTLLFQMMYVCERR